MPSDALTYVDRLGTSECLQVRMLEEKCWMKSLTEIKLDSTASFNTIQHGVQTETTVVLNNVG